MYCMVNSLLGLVYHWKLGVIGDVNFLVWLIGNVRNLVCGL